MSEIFQDLNDDNFLLFAIKAYDNPNRLISEFEDDIKRIDYLKRLFFRYKEYDDLKERLILNHMIILNNVFGPEHLSRILYLKMKDQFKYLKPFLILLNILPDRIYNVGEESTVFTDTIVMDETIVKVLRDVRNG